MALNRIYAGIETEQRVVVVGSNVAPGTPLIISGQPVVTLTGSGDYVNTRTIVAGDSTTTISRANSGGVGLLPTQATVTPTGTFAFPVTGATVASRGLKVYLTAAGLLTLTAGSAPANAPYGAVDFFRGEISATDTAVKIGINL